MKRHLLGLFAAAGALAAAAVDWDAASLVGALQRECPFFKPGEEMVFSLKLQGAKGDIPPDTYFVDWERRGDDGVTEKGRGPLPVKDPLVIRTRSDRPGFVCIEANVVTADGRRVPKNHRWEKRVFFMGGAAVSPDELQAGTEPADYEAFWRSVEAELAAVPVSAEMKPWPCGDKGVRLYAVKIACAGPRPVTGWLTMPADASPAKRYPILAAARGASQDDMPAPKGGPHDRIRMEINGNGFDLGRGEAYVKAFFKSICAPGYGYGFDPESNKRRDTSYWKGMAMRAIRYVEWLSTLPEWDGRTLEAEAGSQGGWQMILAASRCRKVTRLTTEITWGCDWTGQAEFGRLKSTYRPKCWYPDMAYFDAVFAARRVTCPVAIVSAGLGDYVSPPSSLAVLYNNLRVPKSITWKQGQTHGWRPGGMARWTVDDGFADPFAHIRRELERGEKKVTVPKALYRVSPPAGEGTYLTLRGLSDATIDFSGSELRGRVATRFIYLENCTNVTVRNVTLDYEPLPFTQGEIVAADADGTWTVKTLDGYPAPAEGLLKEIWPLQVYDRATLELKNPMRSGAGFRIEKTGAATYRVKGGKNRKGDVGDYAVWNIITAGGDRECSGGVDRDAIHSRGCVRCTFEDITEHSTPGGRAFEEHFGEANVYRRCRIVRRPPEDDFMPRAVRRLRSGGHDAFMSRRAVVGPKILDCTAQYHCDDAVNISGVYGVVSEVSGHRVRLVELVASPFAAGDTAQVMAMDGTVKPEISLTADGRRTAATDEEKAFMRTLGLWPGLAEQCRTAVEIDVVDASGLARGDAVISNRASGNGFEIRGCTFGHNRAFGMRIRASNGLIAGNTVEATEGWGLFIGPEYEWLEGGLSHDVTVAGNRFIGCRVRLGGTAAHRKRLPPEAYRNVEVTAMPLPAQAGWQGAKVAFLGDSITDARHIGCTSNYWNFLERDMGIVPLVYGRNGHQWKDLLGQAERLKAGHPEGLAAIFVFAGTNDYNADVPPGEWWTVGEDSVDRGEKGVVKVRRRTFIFGDATFRGRINAVMRFLKDSWPGTPIYLMTPLHRGYAAFGERNVQPDESCANGKGFFIDDYVTAVKEAGNVWAANVIDLNAESGLFPMLKSHARFFHDEERDMLHPNTAGHELIARAIMRRLGCASHVSGR